MKRNADNIRKAIIHSLQHNPFWIRSKEHLNYVQDHFEHMEDQKLIQEFIKEKSLRNPRTTYIQGTSENQVCIEDMISKKLDELL